MSKAVATPAQLIDDILLLSFIVIFIIAQITFGYYCHKAIIIEEDKIHHCPHQRDEHYKDDKYLKGQPELCIPAVSQFVACRREPNMIARIYCQN